MPFGFRHAPLRVGILNGERHDLNSRRVSCYRDLGSGARRVDGVALAKDLNFVEPQFGPRLLISSMGKVSEW